MTQTHHISSKLKSKTLGIQFVTRVMIDTETDTFSMRSLPTARSTKGLHILLDKSYEFKDY